MMAMWASRGAQQQLANLLDCIGFMRPPCDAYMGAWVFGLRPVTPERKGYPEWRSIADVQ